MQSHLKDVSATEEETLFFLIRDVSLLSCRVNVGCGPAEERLLLTGLHAVADIYCENCHTTLGWKYVSLSSRAHGRTSAGKLSHWFPISEQSVAFQPDNGAQERNQPASRTTVQSFTGWLRFRCLD